MLGKVKPNKGGKNRLKKQTQIPKEAGETV